MNVDDSQWSVSAGERFSAIRELAHLTLEQAASRAGMGVEYLAEIEGGKSEPDVIDLKTLCEIYDVGLDFLLAFSRPPKCCEFEDRKKDPEPTRFRLV